MTDFKMKAVFLGITAAVLTNPVSAVESCPTVGIDKDCGVSVKKTPSPETIKMWEDWTAEHEAGPQPPTLINHYPEPEVITIVTPPEVITEIITVPAKIGFIAAGGLEGYGFDGNSGWETSAEGIETKSAKNNESASDQGTYLRGGITYGLGVIEAEYSDLSSINIGLRGKNFTGGLGYIVEDFENSNWEQNIEGVYSYSNTPGTRPNVKSCAPVSIFAGVHDLMTNHVGVEARIKLARICEDYNAEVSSGAIAHRSGFLNGFYHSIQLGFFVKF